MTLRQLILMFLSEDKNNSLNLLTEYSTHVTIILGSE
jgi:hypothetical protein